MDKIAFVFSGQGAQYSGMGKELYENSPAAKKVFDTADRIRAGTSNQCFFGTKEELAETANTQPCLFCVDLAAAEALKESGISPSAVAGFSLGEIPALTFAGVFSLEEGFQFVLKRAEFMQDAAKKTSGGMAAVLKLSNQEVEDLCKLYQNVFPVNYNCGGQLVVAGEKTELATFCVNVSEKGGKAVPLAVSGAFHSPFMNQASEKLLKELDAYCLSLPGIPVYSNYTSEIYKDDIKKLIALQVKKPVLWQKTIENMIHDGINIFIETGAGKTLCGLIKKIAPDVAVYNVENLKGLENTINAISKGV